MEFTFLIVNTVLYIHEHTVTSQSYTPFLINTNTNTCRYRMV